MKRILPVALIGLLVLLAVMFVASTLRRPEPPSYSPTIARPAEAGDALVGPVVYTVDASDAGVWRRFDFSRGSQVEPDDPLAWDLAFRRNEIIVNGGADRSGQAGVIAIQDVPFDSLQEAPAEGYEPFVADWYDYGFTSHILTPKPVVYAVRTADRRYAKLSILSYYCPQAMAGCVTFRYVYQGNGSRRF